jgi:transposase, IS30 family
MNYKHLTIEERYTIEMMSKEGYLKSEIARCLNRSRSTISREIIRNKGQRGYRHKQAHETSLIRIRRAEKAIRFTEDLKELVNERLEEKWSPDQISGTPEKDGGVNISHESIYQHILEDKRSGGLLYKNLRWKQKKRKKRYGSHDSRGQIPNRVSIDERPQSVADKVYYGDWEGDLIIGKDHQGALLTIVERRSKYTLIRPLSGKNADDVKLAFIEALIPFKGKVRSITLDNGKEFSRHEEISAALNLKIYFAHPYHSWERGLSENTNGLIRQYFPKQMNLKNVSLIETQRVQDQLNSRPRKLLNYKTPNFFYEKIAS